MAYTASFPRGIHSLQANFYLAQAYFWRIRTKSIPNYEYVIEQTRSELQNNLWLVCLKFY
jgi:hypothetical protein